MRPRIRVHAPRVHVSAYVILCIISLYTRARMSRVYISGIRVCALRRYSNTRPNRPAWRYQVSNGPNVRKSPKGAYRGRRGLLFLTKSSRTRAAEETLYGVHIITPASRDARVARARVSTDTLSGTLETLASRQAHDSSRERRSVLEPEEPGRGLSGPLHAKILEPDKFGFSERWAHPSHSSRTRALSSSADLSSE